MPTAYMLCSRRLSAHARAAVEQRAQVHAHHVVGEALGHHEQPAVELLGVDAR